MDELPRHPRLQRRGARYYLRAKVPADLREAIGKREIREALKTSDPGEAVRLVRRRSVAVDDLFEAHRRRLALKQAAPIFASKADLDRVLLQAFHEQERARAEQEPPHQLELEEVLDNLREDEAILSDGLTDVTLPSLQGTAANLLEHNNLSVDTNSPPYWGFLRKLLRGELEGVRRTLASFQGDPTEPRFDPLFAEIDAETPPAPVTASGGTTTLADLIERFEKQPARAALTETTHAGYRLVFGALREVIGETTPVRDISRENCRRVAAVICALPPNSTKRLRGLSLQQAAAFASEKGLPSLHPKTATKYLNNLSALFEWAAREEYIAKNPARQLGMVAPVSKAAKPRLPFSLEQLQGIFGAALFSDAATNPRDGRFWVPLLGLWTGMRLGEIVQLRADDVDHIDGVAVIRVRLDEEGQKRVKTTASIRSVPVHSELSKIGFVDYVEQMRQRGTDRLFPELPMSAKGYYSDPFQKWFSRFLDKSGLKTKQTSFHSFRHCFRDALREANISPEIVRVLGGWAASGSAEAGYGVGHRPATLAREIEKVSYPGLDLSPLYA